jgi:hypothetical protein
MQYDNNVISGTKGSNVESNNHGRTSQATTQACDDQDAPKPMQQLTFESLLVTQIGSCLLLLLQVEVQVEREERCLPIKCLTIYCNRTNKWLKVV